MIRTAASSIRRRTALVPLALALILTALPARADLRSDLREAGARLDRGDRAGALRDFTAIVDQYGNQNDAREAWYFMARLSRSGHEYARGLEGFLDHGGRRDRRAAEVLIGLGRFHYVMGDYRAALTRLEEAREARGEGDERGEARYWLGLTLMALGEWDDARRALEAVSSDPSDGARREAACFALGELHRARGDDGAAVRAFSDCRESRPEGDYQAAARLGEAQCRERQGDQREAAALYAEILKQFPSSVEAAEARAWLSARKSREVARDAPAAGDGAGPVTPAPARTMPPAESETPAPGPAGEWRVQVGAFAARENAARLAADLERRGYPAVSVEAATGQDEFFHVRFGRYRDEGAAVHAAAEVSSALGLRYQLVPPGGESGR